MKNTLRKMGFSEEDAELLANIHKDISGARMNFNMGGVGYDIDNSDNLSECEKEHLIEFILAVVEEGDAVVVSEVDAFLFELLPDGVVTVGAEGQEGQ